MVATHFLNIAISAPCVAWTSSRALLVRVPSVTYAVRYFGETARRAPAPFASGATSITTQAVAPACLRAVFPRVLRVQHGT